MRKEIRQERADGKMLAGGRETQGEPQDSAESDEKDGKGPIVEDRPISISHHGRSAAGKPKFAKRLAEAAQMGVARQKMASHGNDEERREEEGANRTENRAK